MCVRVYGRRVSMVDVRVFCACARGERLLWVLNIINVGKKKTSFFLRASGRGRFDSGL